MEQEEFIIRQVNPQADAEKLAAMWRASDEQWPGTWSHGVPITPQWVLEMLEREKILNIYVVETADHRAIVGYCAFNQRAGEQDVGYVDLLNVDPRYQKRGLARRLLCRCVERCIELGFKQLTLHTWPGNLKAVPLYKKVGLYWVPDTSVYMRNFVPTILKMPCAQPYFERHDWYATLQRVLDQKEDDERWEGMKVFTYRWHADEDMLTVWIDREAQTPTAVETNDLVVAAIADNIEPAKGLPTQMRWKLTNKKAVPMQVSLIASGNEYLQIEHRERLTLGPGEHVVLSAQVRVAADAPDSKTRKPAPTVKTLLVVDGEVIELATGMRPQPAISVALTPRYVTLFPGLPQKIGLQLHNHLNYPVTATVSLTPSSGLTVDRSECQVDLPSKGWGGVPLTLCAANDGLYELQTIMMFDQGHTRPQSFMLFSLPAGGILTGQGQETRIENEWTRLIITPEGGNTQIRTLVKDEPLGQLYERVGPPYWPSELEDKAYEIAVQHHQGCAMVTMTAHLDEYPGLVVQRKMIMGAGPLIEVEYAIGNIGTETHRVRLQAHCTPSRNERSTITVPLQAGLVQSRRSEWPAADEDISKTPEALAERWTAQTTPDGTLGIVWDKWVVENEFGWDLGLLSPELECRPQSWTPIGRLYLYAGPGGWQTVRTHAHRLSGYEEKPASVPDEPRKIHGVRLEPAPLVALDDEMAATLVIDNLRGRPMNGCAELALPDGLIADRSAFEFGAVTVDRPFKQEIKLTLPPPATAYEGVVSLHSELFDDQISVPIIRLGNRERVEVKQGEETWTIDNGRTRLIVAPGFGGAATAWIEKGINHLLSPYPEQKTFGWMSPWYGGITPLALLSEHDMPGKLGNEVFTAQAVERSDERGIVWTGVRLSCTLRREQLAGLAVDLDYLTVGQSNLFKLVYRLRNLTTARRNLGVGWLTYWQPDGEWEKNTLRSQYVERKPTLWESWSEAGKWGLVLNGESRRTAILVSPYPNVWLVDWGNVGGHLGFMGETSVEPSGVTERVCYLALCATPEEASRYIPLQNLF